MKAEELKLAFLDEVSCFETLRVYSGKLFRLEAHWERLNESCLAIGKKNPMSCEELKLWLDQAMLDGGIGGALLRLSLHWSGELSQEDCQLIAIFRPFEGYAAAIYQKGVSIQTAVSRRWTLKAQDPRIKASQFVSGVLAMIDKGSLEAHELLLLGSSGLVAEGTVSNVFIVKNKRILTPSVTSGILKGVTRGVVMEVARECDFKVLETFLTRHELYTADECFMTNTSSEILSVTSVDGRRIASGAPGPIALRLSQDFKLKVKKELSNHL